MICYMDIWGQWQLGALVDFSRILLLFMILSTIFLSFS